MPGSIASISYAGHDHYAVRIGAADIGTGSRTALTQVAADALGTPFEPVPLEIGDTRLPMATVEGVSAGGVDREAVEGGRELPAPSRDEGWRGPRQRDRRIARDHRGENRGRPRHSRRALDAVLHPGQRQRAELFHAFLEPGVLQQLAVGTSEAVTPP